MKTLQRKLVHSLLIMLCNKLFGVYENKYSRVRSTRSIAEPRATVSWNKPYASYEPCVLYTNVYGEVLDGIATVSIGIASSSKSWLDTDAVIFEKKSQNILVVSLPWSAVAGFGKYNETPLLEWSIMKSITSPGTPNSSAYVCRG